MVCESMPSMSVCPVALCFDDADKSPSPVSVATSRSPILSFLPLSFSPPQTHILASYVGQMKMYCEFIRNHKRSLLVSVSDYSGTWTL